MFQLFSIFDRKNPCVGAIVVCFYRKYHLWLGMGLSDSIKKWVIIKYPTSKARYVNQ